MFIQKRRIFADDEIMVDETGSGSVEVAPEASDLLFETQDVAELLAEATGEVVDVTAEDDTVIFAVGEEEFTVTADGDEEVLESVRKNFRNKRSVAATRKAVKSSTRFAGKTIRKVPSRNK